MPTATLTSKGQITIPVEVRKTLGLEAGMRVDFVFRDGVYVIVPPSHPVSRLAGFFGVYEGQPVSIEQMNDDVADAMGHLS